MDATIFTSTKTTRGLEIGLTVDVYGREANGWSINQIGSRVLKQDILPVQLGRMLTPEDHQLLEEAAHDAAYYEHE